MKKVQIVDPHKIKGFKDIDEYLLHTYGENKLKQSKNNSNPTFLDVIGYTLGKRGFETVEGAYYEDYEIEELSDGNLNKENDNLEYNN